MKYSDLAPGQEISVQKHVLDDGFVRKYRDAVGDNSDALTPKDSIAIVPPMAIAALGLRGIINDLGIPDGTVHAGQEIELSSAVAVGDTLNCRATVVQNSTRGGWRFLVVRLQVEGADNRKVMQGKSTIMFPA